MKVKVNNLEALLRNASLLKNQNSISQNNVHARDVANKAVSNNKK